MAFVIAISTFGPGHYALRTLLTDPYSTRLLSMLTQYKTHQYPLSTEVLNMYTSD